MLNKAQQGKNLQGNFILNFMPQVSCKTEQDISAPPLSHLFFSVFLMSLVPSGPAIPQPNALFYQPLALTRQLFSCSLAPWAVMDFLNEALFSFRQVFTLFSSFFLSKRGWPDSGHLSRTDPLPLTLISSGKWSVASDPRHTRAEIWPLLRPSLRLILYTLMQSEVARLNSLSIPPHSFSARLFGFPEIPSWDSFPVHWGM